MEPWKFAVNLTSYGWLLIKLLLTPRSIYYLLAYSDLFYKNLFYKNGISANIYLLKVNNKDTSTESMMSLWYFYG